MSDLRYTGLHQHSVYSVLDGYGKIEDIVKRCKDLGMSGVCISDHGNMFSAYDLYEKCKKHDMKPIFSNEMYLSPGSALVKERIEGYKPFYHLIVIAKNNEGYKNLMRLTSWSWLEGFYYKPRIDLSQLKRHSEGLIVLAACIGGFSQQMILEDRLEEAEDHIKEMIDIFGDNYYLEMQYTGLEEQIKVNSVFYDIHKRLGVRYVITSDAHYVNRTDSNYHNALVMINTGGKMKTHEERKHKDDEDTDESGMYYTKEEYFIKSAEELITPELSNYVDGLVTSNEIAEQCSVDFVTGGKYIPLINDISSEEDAWIELATICNRNLRDYVKKQNIHSGPQMDKELTVQMYRDRLDHELDVIKKMEFASYFLVVAEYINWAKDNGIMVGPARGSAAGSLVAFVSGITSNVDPLKYGLLFSRFLSRGRAKRPAIDFPGFSYDDYLKEKENSNA